MTRKSTAVYAVIAVLLFAASSCGEESAIKADNRPIAEQIVDMRSTGDFDQVPYRSAVEATPKSTIVIDGVVQRPPSDLLVLGKVTAVEPSRSYSWPGGPQVVGGPSTRVEHAFNAPEAWISTVTVEVAVEKSSYVDKRFSQLKVVRFGLSLKSPVDVDAIRVELMSHDKVAALLVANESTPFDQDPDLFGVLGFGEFLGFVDKGGNVEFKASTIGGESNEAAVGVPVATLFKGPAKRVEIKLVEGEMQHVDG
jgi:hypothetical protein